MKTAIFDFDRTLTKRDSIFNLLGYTFRKYPIRYILVFFKTLFIALTFYNFRIRIKQSVLSILKFLTEDDLKAFIKDLYENEILKDGEEEVNKLKEEGYFLILNSASPEVYLKYIKEYMPFDVLIGTRVSKNIKIKENNRGEAKVKRMREDIKGFDNLDIVKTYSDSYTADKPILELAKEKYLINSNRKIEGYDNLWWS